MLLVKKAYEMSLSTPSPINEKKIAARLSILIYIFFTPKAFSQTIKHPNYYSTFLQSDGLSQEKTPEMRFKYM